MVCLDLKLSCTRRRRWDGYCDKLLKSCRVHEQPRTTHTPRLNLLNVLDVIIVLHNSPYHSRVTDMLLDTGIQLNIRKHKGPRIVLLMTPSLQVVQATPVTLSDDVRALPIAEAVPHEPGIPDNRTMPLHIHQGQERKTIISSKQGPLPITLCRQKTKQESTFSTKLAVIQEEADPDDWFEVHS